MYRDYKAEEERMAQKPYFTKYKLNEEEMNILNSQFHVETTPDWWENWNEEDRPDYSYYTIEATEDTKVVVAVMNYWMFEYRDIYDRGGWEKAEEYGITEDNRLTTEWVMEHPREAVEIMTSMVNEGDIFRYLEDIYKVYDKIATENGAE
ncbi:MAG: hypothetical protein GX284_00495 [Clostridiales bacterium]|nr:hypothetical protein [Clostridiales bacterium]